MMFSSFLKYIFHHIEPSHLMENDVYLKEWFSTIRIPSHLNDLRLLELYTRQFRSFRRNLLNYFQLLKTQNGHESIQKKLIQLTQHADEQFNYLQRSFLYMLRLYTKEHPIPFPAYQFKAMESGVSIEAYICTPSERKLVSSAHSSLGSHHKTDIKFDNMARHYISEYCQDSKHHKMVCDRFKKEEYHGEEAWIVLHAKEFIKKIKSHEKLEYVPLKKQVDYDNQWLKNFEHSARIEFVLNTSPCADCQQLFKSLRIKLQQEGIFLPILIYSIYPYNNHETEMSQVNVLSFKGDFIQTHIFMNTVYNQTLRPIVDISLHANVECALEFDAHVYGLISKIDLDQSQQLKENLFRQFLMYIKFLKLSQIDIGVLHAFLKNMPSHLVIHPQFQNCVDFIAKYQPKSQENILHGNTLNEFFNGMANNMCLSFDFDENDFENILQLTMMLSKIFNKNQCKSTMFNFIYSALLYMSLRISAEESTLVPQKLMSAFR